MFFEFYFLVSHMNILAELETINYLAVAAATGASFVL